MVRFQSLSRSEVTLLAGVEESALALQARLPPPSDDNPQQPFLRTGSRCWFKQFRDLHFQNTNKQDEEQPLPHRMQGGGLGRPPSQPGGCGSTREQEVQDQGSDESPAQGRGRL